MKKNNKTYFLLFVVIVVWGVIGYKIFKTINPKDVVLYSNSNNLDIRSTFNFKVDTFSIKPLARDPFVEIKKKALVVSKSKDIQSRKDTIPFVINYLGMISNNEKSFQAYLVEINQKQYVLKKGQQIKGVSLVSGTENIIRVTYDGIIKKITKS